MEESQHQEEVQAQAQPAGGHSYDYGSPPYPDPRRLTSASGRPYAAHEDQSCLSRDK